MFFKPTTVASMVAASEKDDGSPYDLYSDYHKDAIGCRPGAAQMARYNAMGPIERIVEHKRLGEWMAEDERIEAMAHEVAKFRFSRTMEYLMRREGVSEREAFRQTVMRHCNGEREGANGPSWEHLVGDWDYVCYCIGLPYSCAKDLRDFWERQTQD